jgi:glutaredoxin
LVRDCGSRTYTALKAGGYSMRYLILAMLMFAIPANAQECISGSDPILVFRDSTCSVCHAEIGYLREHGIAFAECNTDTSEACDEELHRLTGEGSVPVTYLCNEQIIGYNREKFDEIFGPGVFQ